MLVAASLLSIQLLNDHPAPRNVDAALTQGLDCKGKVCVPAATL
jgi:hypothetical protein